MNFREYHLFQCLKRYDQQSLPLDQFLNLYFRQNKALGSKDRRFLSDTIYHMIRWKALLDWGQDCAHPTWESRYRHLSFNNNAPAAPPHIEVSFPKELFSLLCHQYGEEGAKKICLASNEQAPITIRANTLKISREALVARLKEKYDVSPTSRSPFGIHFQKRLPFSTTPEFQEGLFEVQDEGSQLVSALIKAAPKQKVLDFCAGSGGKTLALAPSMQNQGVIYLFDIRPQALLQAKKRLARAGIFNVQFPSLAQLESLQNTFDWVLVDAPCSGTGTYRRNPDQKWKFSPEMLLRLQQTQRELVEKASPFLKKGGTLVYATCSLLKEENEEQIAYFQEKLPLQLLDKPFISLPTPHGMDGFFAASLKRI